MTWLKSIWRKMFGEEIYIVSKDGQTFELTESQLMSFRPAYDPSTDEHKIMSGEVESYFE